MIPRGIIGGRLGYYLLRSIAGTDSPRRRCSGHAYAHRHKLEVLFGSSVWTECAGKTVIDYGCGEGRDAIALAQHGAGRVIGVDVRPAMLDAASSQAKAAGVSDRCSFVAESAASNIADVMLSVDAFEHFDDPPAILRRMRRLIRPNGVLLAAFGPPWLHPLGGHACSAFPWAHLVFTERALLRWRRHFEPDGATTFREVDGGLNQMTVSRFQRLVDESDFRVETFEPVPIRHLGALSGPITREFFTSIVRCRLAPKN
jgi:SAM-dependent methyltransferase